MGKILATLAVVVFAGATLGAVYPGQEPAAVPADQANKTSPVKPTLEGIERAKKVYAVDCALCHGDDGSGKSDLASSMNLKLKDFREAATLKGKTDGEIYYRIVNGEGAMPAEGNRAKPDDVWNLVVYLRSMSDPTVLPKK
jgi:mono/diheme cytochrome c family protein